MRGTVQLERSCLDAKNAAMHEPASACGHSCELQRYEPDRRLHEDAGLSVVRFP